MGLCVSTPTKLDQQDKVALTNPAEPIDASPQQLIINPEQTIPVLQNVPVTSLATPEEIDLDITDRVTFSAPEQHGNGQLEAAADETTVDAFDEIDAIRTPPEISTEDIRSVYEAFATFGIHTERQTGIDNSKFMKLAKECGFIDSSLTTVDVDMIFTKFKPHGGRKLSFEQFLAALSACAEKKMVSLPTIFRMVVEKGGPESHGTKPDNVRLHDDKSSYTGVAKKGGPSTVDDSRDLASLVDRTDQPGRTSRRSTGGSKILSDAPPTKSVIHAVRRKTGTIEDGSGSGDELHAIFDLFASFGSSSKAVDDMNRTAFVKLCKDCGLISKTFTTTSADIIFTKQAQSKAVKKISFLEFKACLDQIAAEKHMQVSHIQQMISQCGGPVINTTVV